MDAKIFVNYYEILNVSPGASVATIEHSFRNLALKYHPDNQVTGDRSKFDLVIEAHNVLKDLDRRAQYHHENDRHLPPFSHPSEEVYDRAEYEDTGAGAAGGLALDGIGVDRDISTQNSILIMLYIQRRKNVREPGIGDAELERLSGCPAEHLEFHIWYLKAKGWITTGEDGLLAITIDGVDRAAALYNESAKKLLTDQT